MLRYVCRWVLVVMVTVAAGCGYKGDLYMPDQPPPAHKATDRMQK